MRVVANVVEPLVKYRIGHGAYQRRGGRALLRAELALQRTMLDEGLVNRLQYLRNVALRGGYRLVPLAVRRPAYRLLYSAGQPPWPAPVARPSTARRPASRTEPGR